MGRSGGRMGQALGLRAARPARSCRRCSDRAGCGIAIDRFVLARLEREGLKPSPEADRGDTDPPRQPRPDGPAADTRRGRRLPRRAPRQTPTRSSSTACWPRPITASGWPWTGSTRPATPTPTATRTTSPARCGPGATGSSTHSTATSRSTGSSIEQMAGDLLPNADPGQKIATGFNRNNRTVTEAGSIDEEWRIENAIDRVETTATVFLGLTMGCARCHDHKYDPISQTEFYQFFAFFNSINEKGVYTEQRGNVPPLVAGPDPAQRARAARARRRDRRRPRRPSRGRKQAWPNARSAGSRPASRAEPGRVASTGPSAARSTADLQCQGPSGETIEAVLPGQGRPPGVVDGPSGQGPAGSTARRAPSSRSSRASTWTGPIRSRTASGSDPVATVPA